MSKANLSLLIVLRLRTELQRYLKAKSESLLLERLRSSVSRLLRLPRKGDPLFIDFSVTSLFMRLILSHLRVDIFDIVLRNSVNPLSDTSALSYCKLTSENTVLGIKDRSCSGIDPILHRFLLIALNCWKC